MNLDYKNFAPFRSIVDQAMIDEIIELAMLFEMESLFINALNIGDFSNCHNSIFFTCATTKDGYASYEF